MIRSLGTWLAALLVSAVAHALFFLGLALSTKPDAVEPQSVPQTRLDMATYRVDRTEAEERPAEAERAGESAANATSLASAVVPTSRTGGEALPSADAAEVSSAALAVQADVAAGIESPALAAADPEPDLVETLSGSGSDLNAIVLDAGQAQAIDVETEVLRGRAPQTPTLIAEDPASDQASRVTPTTEPLVASAGKPDRVPAATTVTAPILAENNPSTAVALLIDAGNRISSQSPSATQAVLSVPSSASLATVTAPTDALVSLPVASTGARTDAIRPNAEAVGAAQAGATELIPAAMPAWRPVDQSLPTTPLTEKSSADQAEAPSVSTPVGEASTASLAWSGEDGEVDPVSLAAIQAFMQPGDLAGADVSVGRVKDSIASILASVPCARLQTTFRPDTGALELQGHIPEEDLRGPVLAALQTQVGGAIPVADNILILPRPQCGALAGIGAVGLPQSTDQLTNPRVIGPDTHARVYEFSEGQRLTFDLVGPDYDALIYIDYYDADGMVLHLQPNEIIGLELVPAEAVLVVGEERPGEASLNITVAPPFGQEIMVAMAASHRLYDGLRPVREPAEEYLRYMTERVAEARGNHPDFKGEWVYFFVRTTPR